MNKKAYILTIFSLLAAASLAADQRQAQLYSLPAGDFGDISPTLTLSFFYQAEQPGTPVEACLIEVRPQGVPYCLSFTAKDTQWHEFVAGLPGSGHAVRFESSHPLAKGMAEGARALRVRGDVLVRDLNLSAVRYRSDAGKVAAALGSNAQTVRDFRALDLEERLAWALILLNRRCGLTPQEALLQRKTKHWGEIAQDCGIAWPDLMAQVRGVIQSSGLRPTPPTPRQILRSATNDANGLGGRP